MYVLLQVARENLNGEAFGNLAQPPATLEHIKFRGASK